MGSRSVVWRPWPRAMRLVGSALAIAAGLLGLWLLPSLHWLLPRTMRRHPVEWAAGGLVVAHMAGWAYAAMERRGADRVRRLLGIVDRLADRAIFGPGLTLVVAVAVVGLIASWLPHYLTWPWWRDLDHFAAVAQAWDAGLRPYRDVLVYNFPGHIYLQWLLGKTIGWGRTAGFHALDAAFLLALGGLLVAWGRRRFGRALPGLVGFLAVLGYYLHLGYDQVAQRDWHATFFVAGGILGAEGWPGRRGRWASAGATAAACLFRPHVVVFLPALLSAIDEGTQGSRARPARTSRTISEWGLAFGIFLALGFSPLLLEGLGGDFIRALRFAAQAPPYSEITPSIILARVWAVVRTARFIAVLGAMAALMLALPPEGRRQARTWGLALLASMIYQPLHPAGHDYLQLPQVLMESIVLALPTGWVLVAPRLTMVVRLAALAVLLQQALPQVPRYCLPSESIRAIGPLLRGQEPPETPPGVGDWPAWPHYRDLLAYLRRETRPRTAVANVLKHHPFPGVNGPTGRLSPFLEESGILWGWSVEMDLDERFARELERSADSVVVWSPTEGDHPRLRLPRLREVILRLYRPEARFGDFEVWRRKPPDADPIDKPGGSGERSGAPRRDPSYPDQLERRPPWSRNGPGVSILLNRRRRSSWPPGDVGRPDETLGAVSVAGRRLAIVLFGDERIGDEQAVPAEHRVASDQLRPRLDPVGRDADLALAQPADGEDLVREDARAEVGGLAFDLPSHCVRVAPTFDDDLEILLSAFAVGHFGHISSGDLDRIVDSLPLIGGEHLTGTRCRRELGREFLARLVIADSQRTVLEFVDPEPRLTLAFARDGDHRQRLGRAARVEGNLAGVEEHVVLADDVVVAAEEDRQPLVLIVGDFLPLVFLGDQTPCPLNGPRLALLVACLLIRPTLAREE